MLDGLYRVEDRIRYEPVEHFVAVATDGRQIVEFSGKKSSVSIKGEQHDMDMVEKTRPIATHNHPDSDNILLLSPPDVGSTLAWGFSEMRAINSRGRVHAIRYARMPPTRRLIVGMVNNIVFLGLVAACTVTPILGMLALLFHAYWTAVIMFAVLVASILAVGVMSFYPCQCIKLLLTLVGLGGAVQYGFTTIGERLEIKER